MSVDPKMMRGGGTGGKGMSIGSRMRGGMSTAGEVINAFTTVNRFRLASILVWFIGVYTTSIVITQGMGRLPTTDVGTMLGQFYGHNILGAVLVEFIFTTATSPIVTGKGKHPLSIIALFINMGINSIVTLPIAKGLVNSGAWTNINDLLGVFSGTISQGNIRIDMGSGDVIVYTLMIVMAFALAIGAEVLWHMGGRKAE